MLTDPLRLGMVHSGAFVDPSAATNGQFAGIDIRDFALIDVSPGASKRLCVLSDVKITYTCSHSKSGENAPVVTDRSLIRLDFQKVDSVTGKPVTMSVYAVIALPQGSLFDTDDAVAALRSLGMFATYGNISVGAASFDTTDNRAAERILQGEP